MREKIQLTMDEKQILHTINESFRYVGKKQKHADSPFSDELYGESVGLYYNFRHLAKSGSPRAKKMLDELRRPFHRSLREWCEKRTN